MSAGEEQLKLKQLEEALDMFESQELDPELAAWLTKMPSGWQALKHPWVFSVPYSDIMNKHLNMQYAYKKEAIASALKEYDWGKYIFLHERPYRFDAMMKVFPRIEDDRKAWRTVADVWIDSENIWQNQSGWHRLFRSTRLGRDHMMHRADRARVEELRAGEPVPVFRGYHLAARKNGLSWTLDKARAEFFALRYYRRPGDPALVVSGLAVPARIIAYLNTRNEDEVIVRAADVRGKHVTEIAIEEGPDEA